MSRHDHETQTSNRILELELENKRLREALLPFGLVLQHVNDPDLEESSGYWEIRATGAEVVRARRTLSTPPPALAEAYVRLQSIVKKHSERTYPPAHFISINEWGEVRYASAEIARLEKGE